MKKPHVRQPTTAPADKALILACVTYAQSISAYEAGVPADPDGNFVNANINGDKYQRLAKRALKEVAATPAKTWDGIDAKARLIPFLLRDACNGNVDDCDENDWYFTKEAITIIRSLAAETTQRLADERFAECEAIHKARMAEART